MNEASDLDWFTDEPCLIGLGKVCRQPRDITVVVIAPEAIDRDEKKYRYDSEGTRRPLPV
jgi:hypothetical protein